MLRQDDRWRDFEAFTTASGDLRDWRHPLILGEPQAMAAMGGAVA